MADDLPASFLDGPLPEGWSCNTLEELVDRDRGISYGIVQPGRYDSDGVPIVRVNNLRNGRIETEDVLVVSKAIEDKHARTRLQGGEVLLSLVGTLGECAVVPPELKGWNVARAVAVIPVKEGIDARWITTCLRSAQLRHLIQTWATTTVQATLNLRDVRRLPIVVPPDPTREWMVEVLSSLDDKIELNLRTNGLLEGMARAIFKAWFIDFEPVKAKAAGATSFPGMPKPVFDQLPSAFTNCELGEIPEGWVVRSVAELGRFVNGKAFTKHANEAGRMIVRIAELNSGPGASTKYSEVDAAAENTAFPDDILFAWSGSLGVYRWHYDEAIINQHIFKVIPENIPNWFAFHQLVNAMPEFRTIASTKATTMGHIKRGHLDQQFFGMPTTELLRTASEQIGPLYDLVHINERESLKLSAIRDALLPKLISGEIILCVTDNG